MILLNQCQNVSKDKKWIKSGQIRPFIHYDLLELVPFEYKFTNFYFLLILNTTVLNLDQVQNSMTICSKRKKNSLSLQIHGWKYFRSM